MGGYKLGGQWGNILLGGPMKGSNVWWPLGGEIKTSLSSPTFHPIRFF